MNGQALHVTGANGGLDEIEDVDFDALAKASVMHMGGTSLLPKLDGEPTKDILKFAKEKGVTTTFDLVTINQPSAGPYHAVSAFHRLFHAGPRGSGDDDGHEGSKDISSSIREWRPPFSKWEHEGEHCDASQQQICKKYAFQSSRPLRRHDNVVGDAYCAGFITAFFWVTTSRKGGFWELPRPLLSHPGSARMRGSRTLRAPWSSWTREKSSLPKGD